MKITLFHINNIEPLTLTYFVFLVFLLIGVVSIILVILFRSKQNIEI